MALLEFTLADGSPSGPLPCRAYVRVLRVDDVGGESGVAAAIEAWTMSGPADE
jgi:hypothetical protein